MQLNFRYFNSDLSMAEAIFFDIEARETQVGVSSKTGWCEEREGGGSTQFGFEILPTRISVIQGMRALAMSSSMVAMVI